MADEDFVYLNEPHYPVELEKLIMKTDPRWAAKTLAFYDSTIDHIH